MQGGHAEGTDAKGGFQLRWLLACLLGFSIGGAVAGAMILTGELATGVGAAPPSAATPALKGALILALVVAVAMSVAGAAIGLAQWVVLRSRLTGVGWWAPATAGGGALIGFVLGALGGALFSGADFGPLGSAVVDILGALAIGLPPGALQWLVLRRKAAGTGRWLWAHFVGFFVANGCALVVMIVVAQATGWSLPSAQTWALGGVLAGALYGGMTGPRLAQLLRRRFPGFALEKRYQGATKIAAQ